MKTQPSVARCSCCSSCAVAACGARPLRQRERARLRAPPGSITVWVDAVRLPVAKLYAKTHPNVHLNIVTYDGDGNGATTMQTKIQLWNRTGNGWPDVIFTEQANDPVWMGQKPFDYALDLKTVFPKNLLAGWPAPSLSAVHRQRPPGLPPGQPRPGGALRQQEADDPVRLHGPDDVAAVGGARPEGRHGASRLHHREHRRLVRRLALPVGRQVPDLAGRRAEHRQDQLGRRALHAHGEPARSADQERRRPARERLHRGLRHEVGRRQRQDPAHAGTGVVREGHLQRHAARPGRRADGGAAPALEQASRS